MFFTSMDVTATGILLAHLLLSLVSSVTTQNGTTIQQSTQPMPADSSTSSPFSSSSSSSASSSNTSSSSSSSSSSPTNCSCSPAPSPNPPQTPPPPMLGVIGLGGVACEGVVYLTLGSGQPLPLCKWNRIDERMVCQEARCGPFRRLSDREGPGKGYSIERDGTVIKNCTVLHIQCEAGSDSKQLVAYKVVTGLLCVPIIIFLLVQFGPQIYSTICKRFLGRRRREWIGPTESQSVSFYRAQAGLHPNSNADKRQSYPGLERLTVTNSREPSSNRNSDYDSYN
ncbi:hypothetical protein AGOR_G00194520 [Albula goreensis]|uniref:Uncharacterized protein n=1 Tax=Albula goreensis TaxID=1534307 RepID=A0A8T3CWZ0_9TELE|nr:hypothetical protein AGOR_G00194520 [Albula goreensis]